MKKKLIYLLLILPFAMLYSCREEIAVYNEETDRIGFWFDEYKDSTTRYTFVYDLKTKVTDTLWVDVATVGYVADYDRKVALRQVVADTMPQAKPGVHYVAFDNADMVRLHVVKAGEHRARLPIVVLRDPSLEEQEVALTLSIAANDDFQPGYLTTVQKRITISDILTQPPHWDFFASYYFAGEYGKAKHQFMIDAALSLGIKVDDDFFSLVVGNGNPDNVDMGLTDYWYGFFSKKLAEENAARAGRGEDVLREAPEPGQEKGTIVRFTQYVY